MDNREKIIEIGYTIVADELSQFMDEFKVDIRKPLPWKELPEHKRTYWYGRFDQIIAEIEPLIREDERKRIIAQLEAWQAEGTHLVSNQAIDAIKGGK